MNYKNKANARLQNLRKNIVSSPKQGNSHDNCKPRKRLSTDNFSSNSITTDSNCNVDLRTIRKHSHLDIKITKNMVENYTNSTIDEPNIGRKRFLNLTSGSGSEIEWQNSKGKETETRVVSNTLRNVACKSDAGAANKRLESLRRSISNNESPLGESSKSKNVDCQNLSNDTQTANKQSSILPDKTSTNNKGASLPDKVPLTLKTQEKPIFQDNNQLIWLATKVKKKQDSKKNKRLCESLNVPNSNNVKPEKTMDKPGSRKPQTLRFTDFPSLNTEKLVTSTPETKLSSLPQFEQQKLSETWPAMTDFCIFGGTSNDFRSNSCPQESPFTSFVSQALLTNDNSARLVNVTYPETSTSQSDWPATMMQKNPVVAQDMDESMAMDWSDEEPEDVNVPLEQVNLPMPSNQRKVVDLCIIVDTNVFLSHLAILKDLVSDEKQRGKPRPFIYVPWMVLNELDFIKDDYNASQRKNAQNAVKFINTLLSDKSGKLIGQNVYDVDQQKTIGKGPDDKILSCCLQALEKYENVLFLSNDVNLKNKALIHNINVCSSSQVMKQISEESKKNSKVQRISNKMATCCSIIIKDCALEAYGKVWEKFELFREPQPWNLLHCLKIFKKHWSVFQHKVLKQFQIIADNLSFLISKDLCDTSIDFGTFVDLCVSLCFLLKDIEHLATMITHTTKQIIIIRNSID